VKRDAKSVRCVRDARKYSWQSYALANDGRKAEHVAERRRALANHLATYANGDGTSIHVSIDRLLRELGWKERTLYRRLDDLESLGVLSRHGLTKKHGTVIRHLDFSKLKTPRADLPDTTLEQTCQIAPPDLPDRRADLPRIRGRQPTLLTDLTDPHTSSKCEEPTLEEQTSKMRSVFKTRRTSGTKKAGTRIPKNFVVTNEHRHLAGSLGLDADAELPRFVNHYLGNGRVAADWNAQFNCWLLNEPKFKERRNGKPSKAETRRDGNIAAARAAIAALEAGG
jgi:hypothetical protein